jgi:hypothetical protein
VFRATGAARNSATAPSLEQRKDLLKTSGWQIADVVVWDGMRLIVFRQAANFCRPDQVRLTHCDAWRTPQRTILVPDRLAWLLARGSDVVLLTSQPNGMAARAVAIGP